MMYVADIHSIPELIALRRERQPSLRSGSPAEREQALWDIEDIETRILELKLKGM